MTDSFFQNVANISRAVEEVFEPGALQDLDWFVATDFQTDLIWECVQQNHQMIFSSNANMPLLLNVPLHPQQNFGPIVISYKKIE